MNSSGAPATVLVVEDDPAIAGLLRTYLDRAGFAVDVLADGASALVSLSSRHYDAVLLDVGLPGMDGIEVCRRLRAGGDQVPVLFVTARDEEVDRVLGLELGADDYVTKPFSPREIVARVRAVLRRTTSPPTVPPPTPRCRRHRNGALVLDPDARRVWAHHELVELTSTEFDLLHHLLVQAGRVCTRDELLTEVWGYPVDTATRTVDVHVAQLRAKLGDALAVRTVRGVGYAIDAQP